MITTVCPVRSLAPEVREVLMWFSRTHDVDVVGPSGAAVWRLKRYPRAGGLARQDAWLMHALEYTRAIANRLLARRRRGAPPEEELRAFHDAARKAADRVH